MRRSVLAATLLGMLLATGCDPGESNDSLPDPCEPSYDAARAQQDTLADASQDLQRLVRSGALHATPVTRGSWWFNDVRGVDPTALNQYRTLQAKAAEAARVWARIIVNAPECFTPTDVAKAQDWLQQTG